MKKIVMTGGGTAGHVTPNIALFPALQKEGYEISYIGSYEGIEKRLIEEQGVPYYGISSGKLRRYFDPKNFSDPFKVLKGYHQSVRLLKKLKPDVVFSKGGFVSVPVVLAASRCHIPAIIHESDLTPGLANRIAIPKATKVCCNFPETLAHVPEEKAVLTGTPIRAALPGTVTVSKYNAGGYGYYVMIDHGNGLATLYGHCSQLLARVGQNVQAGDIIALSGSTDRSTGPHLHFEVRVNGERANPRAYLPKG